MAHIIIDRRKNDKGKSIVNRGKFVKRVKDQVREAVKKQIRDGNITDVADSKKKKIRIPGKGLSQPTFHHNQKGGRKDIVHAGNKKFKQGDRIPRPQEGGGGGGREGSADGEGEDAFNFHLSRDEFLDLFFEDLELPDLVKKDIAKTDEYINRRAGFSVDGNPSRLNIARSMRQAKGRRVGLQSPLKRKLKRLEKELAELEARSTQDRDVLNRIDELKLEILVLKKKIKAIPFIDDMDLRYNRWEKVPQPTTQAVMFGIMDVSGS